MNKTKIEWVKNQDGTQGYTINPVKGLCPVDCKDNQGKPYCYARRMYLNPYYKNMYEHQEIRFNPRWHYEIDKIKHPSRIFVGSTMELFGDWIKQVWMENILERVKEYPQHNFIFLTKCPQNLIKWSPFPDNCWVGCSATDTPSYQDAYRGLAEVEAKVRFISFEPLLGAIYTQGLCQIPPYYNPRGFPFDWVILGQQTPSSKKTEPRIEWLQNIVEACDKAGVPVFLKDNLKDLLHKPEANMPILWKDYPFKLRQEMPGI